MSRLNSDHEYIKGKRPNNRRTRLWLVLFAGDPSANSTVNYSYYTSHTTPAALHLKTEDTTVKAHFCFQRAKSCSYTPLLTDYIRGNPTEKPASRMKMLQNSACLLALVVLGKSVSRLLNW